MAGKNDVMLPTDEFLCGYIFKCNHRTMPTCLERMMFGLSEHYRHSVETITPGIPLFLYNITTKRLQGIYEAKDAGGYNIDPTFCPDPENPGTSLYPAQVEVRVFQAREPLSQEITREVMQNLKLPKKKFRLVLNRDERNMLRDAFVANRVQG